MTGTLAHFMNQATSLECMQAGTAGSDLPMVFPFIQMSNSWSVEGRFTITPVIVETSSIWQCGTAAESPKGTFGSSVGLQWGDRNI